MGGGSGGKGGQTTTATGQTQNQTYNAAAPTQAAATQALSAAQTAAATPFSQPVAPVAGFNPTQQQAFNQYQNIQGMADPYYQQASGLYGQSAQSPNVASFYNPMAANVTSQLQNIFGEQNSQNTASLTNAAGGVGADRIAVGQGDLANQQTLAAGQTYANLYQQATTAAQAQQQFEQGAAAGVTNLGTTAENTALQGTGALLGSGNQQQQQTQAQLNAPYQNILAQLAYQFQTPQYLAGIAGGLAPALGGTTQGTQFTNQVGTPAQPSLINQIAGLGTAGAGVYGALGGSGSPAYGGGSALTGDAYGGSAASPLPGLVGGTGPNSDYGVGYASGGDVDGGETIDATQAIDPVVPKVNMPAGAGHSGPLTGGMTFAQPPAPQQQQGNSALSDIASIGKTAATVLPFFLKSGGPVNEYAEMAVNYAGRDSHPSTGMIPSQGQWKADGDKPAPDASYNYGKGGRIEHYDDGGNAPSGDVPDLGTMFPQTDTFKDRWAGSNNFNTFPTTGIPPAVTETNPNPVPAGKIPVPRPSPIDAPGSHPEAFRLDPSAKPAADDEDVPDAPPPNKNSTPDQIRASMMPAVMSPYPDATSRDWGQDAARSPWMSLIQAGATMMSTPGPLGSAVGKGLLAGTKSLDTQRTELRSEQELNQKAQDLYEKASEHLDKFNKMTPYERGELNARNAEIAQSAKTGVGKPVRLTGADIARVRQYMQNTHPGLNDIQLQPLIDAEVARVRAQLANQPIAGSAPPAGSSVPIGTPQQFSDGKGGLVTGYWNGSTYAPKAP